MPDKWISQVEWRFLDSGTGCYSLQNEISTVNHENRHLYLLGPKAHCGSWLPGMHPKGGKSIYLVSSLKLFDFSFPLEIFNLMRFKSDEVVRNSNDEILLFTLIM